MAETLLDLTIPIEEETCISNIDVEPASIPIVLGGSGEFSKHFCDGLLSKHFR